MTGDNTLALIKQFVDAAPVSRWLGFSAASDNDDLVFQLSFAEHHIGNALIRALHGGAIAAFLEFSAQAALHAQINGDLSITTVNTDIDYLTSARAQDMKSRVKFLRIGRRLAFVEATGWQKSEATPVAVARFRFRLGDPKK